ncbi:MAG: gene transfer agent family protein [Maricaulaceae bacterium]
MAPALVNPARGEVALVFDGVTRTLCLTLGALAEIEAAFGAKSLDDLADRLKALSAADFIVVLTALLRGGGEPLSAEDVAAAPVDLNAAAQAVGEALRLSLSDRP